MWNPSRGERVALAAALIVLLLQAVAGAGAALEYRRALVPEQPWRLLTAHLVHVNWTHALVNCVAWWALARLFAPDLSAARQSVALFAGALAVGGALLLDPHIAWYRGLSGVLHALYFCGATVWLARSWHSRTWGALVPAALLAAGWVKLVLEQPRGDVMPFAPWLGAMTVPQAHLAGAVAGTALALVFAFLDARRARLNRGASF